VSGDAVHQPTWPLLLKIEHMVKLQVFVYTSNKQQRLSLNILIYYLHSCIYFINISAPGKQNVNITAPVVYTSGLNSIVEANLSRFLLLVYTVDSAYLQSLFVRENFAIKRTLR
jgi:hypothetical protein